MQYGLFLKGIGLSLDDALVFWQRHFTKKMAPEEFLKKYAYNIRHNYGKEGKRADYTPYPCSKIIMGVAAPGPEDAHGCPYRHWDSNRLRAVLEKQGLPSTAVDDIMKMQGTRDYQVACRKQFEARFPKADSGPVGNHPNAYFEAGINFLKGEEKGRKLPEKGLGAPPAPAALPAAPQVKAEEEMLA